MEKQKKVLAMHDLTAMGRVALAPVMTALGAMGHQCVPVPTAVFSTHTGIEGFRTVDLTDWMGEAIAHYEGLELRFDAVLSGFLSSPAQADRVRAGAARKTPDGSETRERIPWGTLPAGSGKNGPRTRPPRCWPCPIWPDTDWNGPMK